MSINKKSGIEIIEKHKAVHTQYPDAKDPAALETAHREICASMRNRGLIHKIEDALDKAATPIRGLYLTPPHGELIHAGKQKAIVRPQPTDFLSETFELCSDGFAYGYIRLGEGQKVAAGDFDQAEWFEKHRVTASAHKRWWPEQAHLWVYEIVDFQPFDEPRPIQLEPGTQTFMKSVRYKAEVPDLVKSLSAKAGEDTVLVPDFLWLVGGAVERPEAARDIDVLYRANAINDDTEFALNTVSLITAVRDALGVSGKNIDHWWNAQGPHQGKAMALADLVLRWKPGELRDIKATPSASIVPGKRYEVMKPRMKGYTEFFDTTELWENWTKDKLAQNHPLLGSPKIDGFRAIISWDGKKPSVWFEDSKEEKTPPGMPDLSGMPPFVIEGEFTAKQDDKWLARTQLAGVVAGKTKAEPHFWLYDLLYLDKDTSGDPFSDNLARLQKLNLPADTFTVLNQRPIKDKAGLEKVGKWAAAQPLSEGLFVRQSDIPYTFGPTEAAAKLKTVAELKTEIIEAIKKKNGIVYHVGLREPGEFSNKADDLLDLGNTFVGPDQHVKTGDTLNVVAEELVSGFKDGKPILFWGKPTAKGPDKTRNAYTVVQAIDLAKRGHIFKEETAMEENSKALILGTEIGDKAGYNRRKCMQAACKAEPEVDTQWADGRGRAWFCLPHFKVWATEEPREIVRAWYVPGGEVSEKIGDNDKKYQVRTLGSGIGPSEIVKRIEKLKAEASTQKALTESSPTGPRAQAAAKFWEENWWKMFPPSGKGVGTYQHHYPALTEEQLGQNEKELLGQNVAVHGDLRLTSAFQKSKPDMGLWGFTPFLGKASEVREADGCKLCQSAPLNLQGTFKLPEPIEWLNIASKAPHIETKEEGGVGITGKDGAKFFEVDHPDYEMGVWREHLFEIFLKGKKLKGRHLIEYAPVAEGRRIWLLNKPENQTPYAESHDLEKTLAELKGKGQKYLVWAKPGEKPVLYDTETGKPTTVSSAKIGRRLRKAWVDQLANFRDKIESQFDEWREFLNSFRSFVEYEDEIIETLPDDWLSLIQGSKGGFKAFRGKDGQRRWFAWAASAFEDREEEIFSTKSLENDVAECYKTGNHGKLWFHHLPIYLGDAEFSALIGRILLKSGTWADNKIAQSAADYYEQDGVPDEGASVGYRHRITEPDENGIYHWIRVFETSPVPMELAAFPFSRFDTIGDKAMFEMNDAQIEHLKRVFGDEWEAVIENVKTVSGQLEEAGLAFKAVTNPVAALKMALGKIEDAATKKLIAGVIETLEKREQKYGKPTKANPKEDYEKPKDKEPKEGKKTYDPEVLSALVEGLNLQELVEAVKALTERVGTLDEKLEAGDAERFAKKIAKVAPIVAYQQSVAALTEGPEGQKDAAIPKSDPLAELGKGTVMGIRR